MKRPVVVVGSINLDLVCAGERIPAPGETVRGDRFSTFHGGKGANQAVAAGRLGAAVHMVGKVGDDPFGEELRQGLQERGVLTDHVTVEPGISSGVALITVDKSAQNSIIVVAGANGELRPDDLERCRPLLVTAGIVLAQLEIPLETVVHLSELLERSGVPLMLDPAPVLAEPLPPELLPRVTYLTPNETEACALCSLPPGTVLDAGSAPPLAERLLAMGVRNVVLKLGDKGVFFASHDGTREFVAAFAVEAIDTTAAGDAFNGGFATGLTEGMAPLQAVNFGAAVAALSVTRHGAQSAMPSMSEVQSFLEQSGRSFTASIA